METYDEEDAKMANEFLQRNMEAINMSDSVNEA